jgi:hypothetical protein
LAINHGKQGKPQQQQIQFAAKQRERRGNDADRGESRAEKQVRLVAVKDAQDLVRRILRGHSMHATRC